MKRNEIISRICHVHWEIFSTKNLLSHSYHPLECKRFSCPFLPLVLRTNLQLYSDSWVVLLRDIWQTEYPGLQRQEYKLHQHLQLHQSVRLHSYFVLHLIVKAKQSSIVMIIIAIFSILWKRMWTLFSYFGARLLLLNYMVLLSFVIASSK